MNWPQPSDYQDAIQNPSTCFQLPELRGSRVATNQLGLPRVASGNFASVYQLQLLGRRWAVRCFLRPITDQHRRYERISDHVSDRRLTYILPFHYLTDGIRLRNEWYPIVKMEWADGEPLDAYIRKNLMRPDILRNLSDNFIDLMGELRDTGIAHGDLQHANILVDATGRMALVDYDGMYVPTLESDYSPELGHSSFQHPRRSPQDYGPQLDDFAALVIYTALKAVSEDPSVWQDFHNGDNLIFAKSDFVQPARSVLFDRLLGGGSSGLKTLGAALRTACLTPCTAVPRFHDVVRRSRPRTHTKPSPDAPGCLMFVVDRSAAMSMGWGSSGRRAADLLADALNRALQNLIERCTVNGRISNLFDVSVIGYSRHASSMFDGRLNGRELVSVGALAAAPMRIETRLKKMSEEGEGSRDSVEFPVWIEAASDGEASLAGGFQTAFTIAQRWTRTHQHCPPPVILHLTAGSWPDQSCPLYAERLLQLGTRHGSAVVLNCLIGRTGAPALVFPERDDTGFNACSRILFQASSDLPLHIRARFSAGARARGLVVDAGYADVVQLIETILES